MELVGDRFVRIGASWIDLATGACVHLIAGPAGSLRQQLAWSDRCATLSLLRHPLINPLVDYGAYGAAGNQRTFEAYAVSQPLRASGDAACELLTHAARFLERHGIGVTRTQSGAAIRSVVSARVPNRGRPLGVVLQRRSVMVQVAEALAEARTSGFVSIVIAGEPGSGLRTVRDCIARAARLEGYVPIGSEVIERWPGVTHLIADRHVCVLAFEEEARAADARRRRAALARLISDLGLASARRHVLIRFRRPVDGGADEPGDGCLDVGAMGVTAMTAMVFLDPHTGPGTEQVWRAAQAAEGSPGRFLERLKASRYPEPVAGALVVHEARPDYVVRDSPNGLNGLNGLNNVNDERPVRRPLAPRLERASERAARLAGRGRHAAAARLLTRAIHVLESRGEVARAEQCVEQLAWTLRARGRSAEAETQFQRARGLAADDAQRTGASIGLGVAWTDAERFAEAEAALRAATTSASVLGDAALSVRAGLALARCLFWQRRFEEARLQIESLPSDALDSRAQVEAAALTARILAAAGDCKSAIAAASDAVAHAGDDARLIAVASRAMAVAQTSVGDASGARASLRRGLATAAQTHLPLLALRLRAALLATMPPSDPQRERLTMRMRYALRQRALPPLLRTQIERACAARTEEGSERHGHGASSLEAAMAELRAMLELAHGAPDDRDGTERIARDLLERLRATAVQIVAAPPDVRVLARAGRPWQGDLHLVDRVVAGASAPSCDARVEGLEAAAVVRYGEDPIGAVVCRWTPGTMFDAGRTLTTLRAAALAAAASVRGLLDRQRTQAAETTVIELIGTSPPMAALRETIARAARAPFPVLVEGESGSGKELVARAIHRLGPRRERRLCALNCAALSDDLVEAELFGHARGAYTGAVGERAGLFEEADGGTLFLDEVGELSARAQAKLLRVLQDGEVRRVGENVPRRVDARIVAATNRSLEHEADAGRFRADLRYRLDVIRVRVPPLRDRASDIPALALHFWDDATRRVGSAASLAPETLAALARYEWPGNVRELQNAISSIAVHSPRRGRVTPQLVPAHVARGAAAMAVTFDAARDEFERRFVSAALARAGGRRSGAARALGVTRQGLTKMMRRLKIEDA